MTGLEGAAAAAAGKALVSAAEQAKANDASSTQQLQALANDSPTLQVAAETYAARIAVKQAILLKLFKPLAKIFGVAQEYYDDGAFARDMAAKTADIPDEYLEAPRPSIAIPAIQALAYSLDEPDLKEMYLNLLAAATDARRPNDAHPSFAEIIKQLSPPEAKLLQDCLRLPRFPIVRIKLDVTTPHVGFINLRNHVFNWTDDEGRPADIELGASYIDNWVRLGLVEVTYAELLLGDDSYSWVEERKEYQSLIPTYENQAIGTLGFAKGILRRTDFGLRFFSAVSH